MIDDIKKISKYSLAYALDKTGTKLVGLALIPIYTNIFFL